MGERTRVTRRHEESPIPQHCGYFSTLRRDDRHAAGHGFDQDPAELLHPRRRGTRREDKHVQTAQECRDGGVRKRFEKPDAVVHALRPREGLQRGAFGPLPCDEELRVVRQLRERVEKDVHALLRNQTAHVTDGRPLARGR